MPIVRKTKNGARWVENVPARPSPAELLADMLAAWRADINSTPFPANPSSAPEATK